MRGGGVGFWRGGKRGFVGGWMDSVISLGLKGASFFQDANGKCIPHISQRAESLEIKMRMS